MCLQVKGWVLCLAVTRPGKSAGAELVLLVAITNRCQALVLRGIGNVVGIRGRPIFMLPMAVWLRMEKYSSDRWAMQEEQVRIVCQH